MRIVDRKTFMTLPEGTVYSKHFNDDGFGELAIKSSSPGVYQDDWVYLELSDFDNYDESEQRHERIEKMRKEGASYPLKLDNYRRDGLFEEDQLFAIYEEGDVLRIIGVLLSTLEKPK